VVCPRLSWKTWSVPVCPFKAAASDRSISAMVNEAVKAALAEDAEDLAAFDQCKGEQAVSFESFVRDLRQRGRI